MSERLCRAPDETPVPRVRIFLVVRGLSTLPQYLVLFTLVELCRADAILASSVGFAISCDARSG